MTDPRWLTAEQLSAWKKLIAVVELLPGTLESQLQRDSGLSHFEYFTLAMLSEAPDRTLRMTTLAAHTNATLARLSHVVSRLEKRGLRAPGAVRRRTAGRPTRSSPPPAGRPSSPPRRGTSARSARP